MDLPKTSRAKLKGVHPDLVRVVDRCAKDWKLDFPFIVTCGTRTLEEQKILVRNHKSTTLRSRHIPARNGYGHAVDLAAVVGGKLDWTFKNYARIASAMKAAAKAEGVPLEWGGDWASFVDGPHFQLPWAKYPGTKGR